MLASLRGTLLRKGHSCRADSFPSKEACKVFSQTCECLWHNHEQGTTNPLQINKRKGSDFSLVDVCISVSQLNSVTSKHTCLGPRRQTEAWEFALTQGPWWLSLPSAQCFLMREKEPHWSCTPWPGAMGRRCWCLRTLVPRPWAGLQRTMVTLQAIV